MTSPLRRLRMRVGGEVADKSMPVLKNVRREKMAQNRAKGMSWDAAHTAAGYKPSRQNAARMSTYDDIVGRVAELMAPARLFRIVKFRARYAEEQRGSDEHL